MESVAKVPGKKAPNETGKKTVKSSELAVNPAEPAPQAVGEAVAGIESAAAIAATSIPAAAVVEAPKLSAAQLMLQRMREKKGTVAAATESKEDAADAPPKTMESLLAKTKAIAAEAPKKISQEQVDEAEEVHDTYEEQLQAEFDKNPYAIVQRDPAAPLIFHPLTRRGVGPFLAMTFRMFTLDAWIKPKIDPCKALLGSGGAGKDIEIFQYQKFVREYLRSATPYRGLLVYHGLGSGKTCSAIGAAEALYSQSQRSRKIIIMTPGSLRGNFQSQIQFCGFRHYRLENHWVRQPIVGRARMQRQKLNPLRNRITPEEYAFSRIVETFAVETLNIPAEFLEDVKRRDNEELCSIWVPDFSKKVNYNSLASDERSAIRAQIIKTLENTITFINYNGILGETLKDIACNKPDMFDNATIIIDEFHNLANLMAGKVAKYMEQSKKSKRKADNLEPITTERWKPKLCDTGRNYERAFLFYRLLCGARNSKILALSGTPIINEPDQLAITTNILAGYIHTAEGTLESIDEAVRERLRGFVASHPRLDSIFYSFTPTDKATKFRISIFPEGYVKYFVDGAFKGLIENATDAGQQTIQEAFNDVKEFALQNAFAFRDDIRFVAHPRLPVSRDEFNSTFINLTDRDNPRIVPEAKTTLMKRMFGFVSYYKGATEGVMPTIERDEIVYVPLSGYALEYYIQKRTQEIKDAPKKTAQEENEKSVSSYRFNSRAACNFAFPTTIPRPFRKRTEKSQKDVDEKVEMGEIVAEADVDLEEMAEDLENRKKVLAEDTALKQKLVAEEGFEQEELEEEESLSPNSNDDDSLSPNSNEEEESSNSNVTSNESESDVSSIASESEEEEEEESESSEKPAVLIKNSEKAAKMKEILERMAASKAAAAAAPASASSSEEEEEESNEESLLSNTNEELPSVSDDENEETPTSSGGGEKEDRMRALLEAQRAKRAASAAVPSATSAAAPKPATSAVAAAEAAKQSVLAKLESMRLAKTAAPAPLTAAAASAPAAAPQPKSAQEELREKLERKRKEKEEAAAAAAAQAEAAISPEKIIATIESLVTSKIGLNHAQRRLAEPDTDKAKYTQRVAEEQAKLDSLTVRLEEFPKEKTNQILFELARQATKELAAAKAMVTRTEGINNNNNDQLALYNKARAKLKEKTRYIEAFDLLFKGRVGQVQQMMHQSEDMERAIRGERVRSLLPGKSDPSAIDASKIPTGEFKSYDVELAESLALIDKERKKYLLLDGAGSTNLSNYSPKYEAMIRKIEALPGSSLVYSQFKSAEGLGIFGYSLKANGYYPITLTGTGSSMRLSDETIASFRIAGAKRYIFFTGEGDLDQRKAIINIFNGNFGSLSRQINDVIQAAGYKNNQHGEICRVIGITGAGAEGISLKCVRGVHIMEPYWNRVRTEQVKGRAVRICSHADLSPEERNVSIYTYCTEFSTASNDVETLAKARTIMTFDSKQVPNPAGGAPTIRYRTSDEVILDIGARKEKINTAFLNILKQVAVDCGLNYQQNDITRCIAGVPGTIDEPAFSPDWHEDIQQGLKERVAGAEEDIVEFNPQAQAAVAPTAAAAATAARRTTAIKVVSSRKTSAAAQMKRSSQVVEYPLIEYENAIYWIKPFVITLATAIQEAIIDPNKFTMHLYKRNDSTEPAIADPTTPASFTIELNPAKKGRAFRPRPVDTAEVAKPAVAAQAQAQAQAQPPTSKEEEEEAPGGAAAAGEAEAKEEE